jgi:hypothetical protein
LSEISTEPVEFLDQFSIQHKVDLKQFLFQATCSGHTCNPGTWEAEAGGAPVLGQPGLPRDTLVSTKEDLGICGSSDGPQERDPEFKTPVQAKKKRKRKKANQQSFSLVLC